MQITDITEQLPRGTNGRYLTRRSSEVKSIAIHHSATRAGSASAFAEYHVHTMKFPGIAYHYVICKDGHVYKCNKLSTVSYHVGDSNREAIGICLIGDYDHATPPPAQLAAAEALVKELLRSFPKAKVLRHHDYPGYSWKSCPGKLFPWEEFKAKCLTT